MSFSVTPQVPHRVSVRVCVLVYKLWYSYPSATIIVYTFGSYLWWVSRILSGALMPVWFWIRSFLLFSNMFTLYLSLERRCRPSASVHIARGIGYRPGPCMDNKCYVRFITYLCVLLSMLRSRVLSNHSLIFSRFLKAIDRFNELVVSVYVTAGHILNISGLINWFACWLYYNSWIFRGKTFTSACQIKYVLLKFWPLIL